MLPSTEDEILLCGVHFYLLSDVYDRLASSFDIFYDFQEKGSLHQPGRFILHSAIHVTSAIRVHLKKPVLLARFCAMQLVISPCNRVL